MRRRSGVPGRIFINPGRYWWRVKLPGEETEKARPLVADGGTFATDAPDVAEQVAREGEPVRPIAEAWVRRTMQFLPPTVAAMVELQMLTAMRPGELCILRREMGLDAARALLGRRSPGITDTYAELDQALAVEAARKPG